MMNLDSDEKVILGLLENVWPFKRITIDQDMLVRFNKEFGTDDKEFSFTVEKKYNPTDEELYELMKEMHESTKNGLRNTPSTGMKKNKLSDF